MESTDPPPIPPSFSPSQKSSGLIQVQELRNVLPVQSPVQINNRSCPFSTPVEQESTSSCRGSPKRPRSSPRIHRGFSRDEIRSAATRSSPRKKAVASLDFEHNVADDEHYYCSQPSTSCQVLTTPSTVSVSHVSNVKPQRQLLSFTSMTDLQQRRTSPDGQRPLPVFVHNNNLMGEESDPVVDGVTAAAPTVNDAQITRKPHRKVTFQQVDVYYFNRSQSFDTVPSNGGVALGMAQKHHDYKKFSCTAFHKASMRENTTKYSHLLPARRSTLKRPSRLSSLSQSYQEKALGLSQQQLTSEPWKPDAVDDFSWNPDVFEALDGRMRLAIMNSAQITCDLETENECRLINESRKSCGCSCAAGGCSPQSCECFLHDIGCLVDRPGFPCSCSAESCANPLGRHEFDPDKVNAHKQRVLERAEQERKARRGMAKTALKRPDSVLHALPQVAKESEVDAEPKLVNVDIDLDDDAARPALPSPTNITVRKRKYPVTPVYRQTPDSCAVDDHNSSESPLDSSKAPSRLAKRNRLPRSSLEIRRCENGVEIVSFGNVSNLTSRLNLNINLGGELCRVRPTSFDGAHEENLSKGFAATTSSHRSQSTGSIRTKPTSDPVPQQQDIDQLKQQLKLLLDQLNQLGSTISKAPPKSESPKSVVRVQMKQDLGGSPIKPKSSAAQVVPKRMSSQRLQRSSRAESSSPNDDQKQKSTSKSVDGSRKRSPEDSEPCNDMYTIVKKMMCQDRSNVIDENRRSSPANEDYSELTIAVPDMSRGTPRTNPRTTSWQPGGLSVAEPANPFILNGPLHYDRVSNAFRSDREEAASANNNPFIPTQLSSVNNNNNNNIEEEEEEEEDEKSVGGAEVARASAVRIQNAFFRGSDADPPRPDILVTSPSTGAGSAAPAALLALCCRQRDLLSTQHAYGSMGRSLSATTTTTDGQSRSSSTELLVPPPTMDRLRPLAAAAAPKPRPSPTALCLLPGGGRPF